MYSQRAVTNLRNRITIWTKKDKTIQLLNNLINKKIVEKIRHGKVTKYIKIYYRENNILLKVTILGCF